MDSMFDSKSLGNLHNELTKAVTAPARREPVAPWVPSRLGICACEACAERAGVFGPVDATWELPLGLPVPNAEPPAPTCAGPLGKHGTPVLRHIGRSGVPTHWCEPCYMRLEFYAAKYELRNGPARPSEPPARVGTVPQSLGAMRGIWASRGMR